MKAVMSTDRVDLQFPETVVQVFSFLLDYGFQQIEALPTLVRYRCGDLEARVFHGPRSHELGFEIEREGERFDISEIIALSVPSAADRYRNPMVRTPSAVNTFLQQLQILSVATGSERYAMILRSMRYSANNIRCRWSNTGLTCDAVKYARRQKQRSAKDDTERRQSYIGRSEQV
jgi:hypothetical protein